MSLLEQGTPVGRATGVPDRPHWFTGVLLGGVGWLIALTVIFALLGKLIVSSALLAGVCLCVILLWRTGRRRRRP